MKNQEQAKVIWRHLVRKELLCRNIDLDKADVLPVTKDVAMCILANPGISLEDIIKEPYFKNTSRSTLKRATAYLYTKGYIKHTKGKDKRVNHLYFKKVD